MLCHTSALCFDLQISFIIIRVCAGHIVSYTQDKCISNCNFHYFRARVRGYSNIISAEDVRTILQNWVDRQGTFLFNYYGRIRMWLLPCPVRIESFEDPECKEETVE